MHAAGPGVHDLFSLLLLRRLPQGRSFHSPDNSTFCRDRVHHHAFAHVRYPHAHVFGLRGYAVKSAVCLRSLGASTPALNAMHLLHTGFDCGQNTMCLRSLDASTPAENAMHLMKVIGKEGSHT
eukprot:1159261-Pelagomonas_calceolata.AAC.1